MSDQPEIPVETLAETDNYSAWRSQEPDGEVSYHLEFGGATIHFFDEEWQEFMELIKALPSDSSAQNKPSPQGKRK